MRSLVIALMNDQGSADSTASIEPCSTSSTSPLLRSIQYNFSNNTWLRSTPTMSHILLDNFPFYARFINKRLRRLRRKRTVQHRLEPNSASIKSTLSPERWQGGKTGVVMHCSARGMCVFASASCSEGSASLKRWGIIGPKTKRPGAGYTKTNVRTPS